MSFGKWLIVGLELALFIMGITAFDKLHEPGILVLTGLEMMAVGVFYAICCDVSK